MCDPTTQRRSYRLFQDTLRGLENLAKEFEWVFEGSMARSPEKRAFAEFPVGWVIVDLSLVRLGGAQLVRVRPLAPRVGPPPGGALPVRVRTDAGEDEELRLEPERCMRPDGGAVVCDEFVVMMEPGRDVAELTPRLVALGARFTSVGGCPATAGCRPEKRDSAAVRIFRGELESAMVEAAMWPGVEQVDYNGFLRFGAFNREPELGALLGGAPLEFADPSPRDGVVQVRPGDTVTVEYSSATGSSLAVDYEVPEALGN